MALGASRATIAIGATEDQGAVIFPREQSLVEAIPARVNFSWSRKETARSPGAVATTASPRDAPSDTLPAALTTAEGWAATGILLGHARVVGRFLRDGAGFR
jgi:hypothetical protein